MTHCPLCGRSATFTKQMEADAYSVVCHECTHYTISGPALMELEQRRRRGTPQDLVSLEDLSQRALKADVDGGNLDITAGGNFDVNAPLLVQGTAVMLAGDQWDAAERQRVMFETPDFDWRTQRLLDEHVGTGEIRQVLSATLGPAIVQALKELWNARGAADIATIELQLAQQMGASASEPYAKNLDRALRALDRW